jgi:hypothetical protein
LAGEDVTRLQSEKEVDRRQAEGDIRDRHQKLVEKLIRILSLSEPVKYQRRCCSAPHLSIELLGELRAPEAVPYLLDYLEWAVPEDVICLGRRAFRAAPDYPACHALVRIGMPAVDPVVKQLGQCSQDGPRRDKLCWILDRMMGAKLARARILIAIEDAESKSVQANLSAGHKYFKLLPRPPAVKGREITENTSNSVLEK